MEFSATTTELLGQLELLAKKELVNRNALGTLIELAAQINRQQTLDDLAFTAKFSHRTFRIMGRIGKHADGYDRLSKEFGESIEKAKNLLHELLAHAHETERAKFAERYLSMTPAAFEHLLTLLHELSWYKNYLIDARERRASY